MSPTLILSVTKAFVKNRKLQLMLVGLQFMYITYKMVKENEASHKRNAK